MKHGIERNHDDSAVRRSIAVPQRRRVGKYLRVIIPQVNQPWLQRKELRLTFLVVADPGVAIAVVIAVVFHQRPEQRRAHVAVRAVVQQLPVGTVALLFDAAAFGAREHLDRHFAQRFRQDFQAGEICGVADCFTRLVVAAESEKARQLAPVFHGIVDRALADNLRRHLDALYEFDGNHPIFAR